MTFSDFVPMIASHLGLAPATLVFLIFCMNQGAKVVARLIPNDASGLLATVGRVCTIIGADPSSRITAGISVQDVAKQALSTPPITGKVLATMPTGLTAAGSSLGDMK